MRKKIEAEGVVNIMVVEQPCARMTELVARLRGFGYSIRHCSDPAQAQSLVRARAPDLLICGVALRGAGDEACTLAVPVTAQFHNPGLATILMTDSAAFAQGDLFAMLGSLRCVLRRPPDIGDLVEIARHFLRAGPVRCTPSSRGGEICKKCLLSGRCEHSLRARAIAGKELRGAA